MKQRIAVMTMAMVLVAAMTAEAQPGYFSTLEKHRLTNLEKVVCRYVDALKSENAGVKESALSHLVRMKLFVPELRCPNAEQEIAALAIKGETPTIRYKAYLASLVFDMPQVFATEKIRNFEDPEHLFGNVATKLQVALIGQASNTDTK
jgi:hypothetical protein